MKWKYFILVLLLDPNGLKGQDTTSNVAGDSVTFSGQLSAWTFINEQRPRVGVGARYIPQLNYRVTGSGNRLFDMELSVNANGGFQYYSGDSIPGRSNLRPYRAWIRYSTSQFELRAGLQKINFGSASMLRPLMWFEQVDPRDPLRITTGVWGVLGRYYFLNNANIWLWSLLGNHDPKTWELGKTQKWKPEFGGRIQAPFAAGEAGISFHHREADTRGISNELPQLSSIPENRIGVDGKWDYVVGIWVEATWINKGKSIGQFTNQQIFNVGSDYTFNVGNGLNATFEQLFISYDRRPFELNAPTWFSALSVSYPATISDTFNAIVYYDWTNSSSYNFINWKRQFNNFYLYVMGYWNPSTYALPQQQGSGGTLFTGKGVQIMFVYNH
jgi:hypothetical protein